MTEDARSAVAALWERFRAVAIERVEVVEGAIVALLEGDLDGTQRRLAERAAHKLAGSAGTFGFMEASHLAREIELKLADEQVIGPAEMLRLSEAVVAVRRELERSPEPVETLVPSAEPPETTQLLLVDNDREVADRLTLEAVRRGLHVVTVASPAEARAALEQVRPDVVLLDLDIPGWADEGLDLLADLSQQSPPVPVVVLTGRDSFVDRVQVAVYGGRGFLTKTAPPEEVMDAVSRVLESGLPARVLVVDDDPQILVALRSALEPAGIQLKLLEDPRRFWDALESAGPDLLLLDVDMPHLSGIELCRVIRNDARWDMLPVIFLSARTDRETIDRIFAAGADDYVSKPFIGPELLTRIRNRLERTRLHHRMAATDGLTGVAGRQEAGRILDRYVRLAGRQEQPLSVALLDIDGLREINRDHGYGMGDSVLQRVGSLLSASFRSEDVVGRWDGDAFIVGMYGMTRSDGIQRLADTVERLHAEPLPAPGGRAVSLRISGGVAQFPPDGTEVQALCREAEGALIAAKRAGGGRIVPVGWTPVEGGESLVDVVLVDDDETLAGLLLHALETRGYRTAWLQDGMRAAEELTGSPPSLRGKVLLLDVDLPGKSGLTVLRQLASEGVVRRTRIIMLTARAAEAEVVEALELGAGDHVAKPFSLPVLMQRIRGMLEQ